MANKRSTALLASAIVNRAVHDWKDAKVMLKKVPTDRKALETIEEIEDFFGSKWYQLLRELAPEVIPKDMMRRLEK